MSFRTERNPPSFKPLIEPAAETDLAPLDVQQVEDAAADRRLAAPALADESDRLPFGDEEGCPVDGDDLLVLQEA